MRNEQKFWDCLSEKYDKQVKRKFSKAYEDTINKTRRYLDNSFVIMDFGCGTGIVCNDIAQDVNKVLALDYSEKMINIAKNKADEQGITNIKFSVSSIFDNDFLLNSFDVILAINILCYIKDDRNIIKRIYELLKHGGFFISVTDCLGEKKTFMTQAQKLLSKTGVIPFMNFYKMDDLNNLVKTQGFDIIEKENLYVMPPNYFIAAKKQ